MSETSSAFDRTTLGGAPAFQWSHRREGPDPTAVDGKDADAVGAPHDLRRRRYPHAFEGYSKKALLKTGVGGLGPGSMGSTRGDRGVASSVSRDWTSSTRASGTRSNIRQPCRARRAGSNIKVRGGGGAQSRSFEARATARPVRSSSQSSSLLGVSGSWSPSCIAGIFRRSPARRPSRSASRRTGTRRTATTGCLLSGFRRCSE